MKSVFSCATLAIVSLIATSAAAGVISDENGKTGIAGGWPASNDGTAKGKGVVDVYPARWSIKPGEAIKLKVRSSATYTARVMRVGWYGGAGAREFKAVTGQAPNAQPYPSSDPKFGMAEARWADSVTIPTDDTWTPGFYVARIEQADGAQAATFFTIRDDSARLPVLAVLPLTRHAAYNAWPGLERGGKSLYGFNSSPNVPTDSIASLVQAVKVSLDRPFYVGAGTADLGIYEVPFIRWAEREGWDIAYCMDADLHENPSIAMGRKAMILIGHHEYYSRPMFDALVNARDSGVHLLSISGDTISWQVRFEPGPGGPLSTVVGYKESWVKDPEQKAAYSLKTAGKIEEAKARYRLVTRGFKNLEYDPAAGIDERRPGMVLTGVQSAGIIRDGKGDYKWEYPWADFVVNNSSFWLFDGTGIKGGDKIANVMGYEVDSAMAGSPEFDPFRPAGQMRIGTIVQVGDGKPKGSVAFFQKDVAGGKRVETLSLGAMAFTWALDDFAAVGGGYKDSVDPRAQRMITNVLKRWTGDNPVPPVDPGPGTGGPDDPQGDPVEKDGGTLGGGGGPSGGGGQNGGPTGSGGGDGASTNSGGGCSMERSSMDRSTRSTSSGAGALAALLAGLWIRRRRSGAST